MREKEGGKEKGRERLKKKNGEGNKEREREREKKGGKRAKERWRESLAHGTFGHVRVSESVREIEDSRSLFVTHT